MLNNDNQMTLLWAYYSLYRSSLCTGPTAVDKGLNTINDVKYGVYSGFKVWFSKSSQWEDSVQEDSTMDDNRC